MVKKKQFINKKSAQHFHVVHRSQRDPKANDPEASKYVLLSSDKPVEFASDDEYDADDYDDASDDDMPDLIDSPSAPSTQLTTTKNKTKARHAAQPLRTRKVRIAGVEAEDVVDELGMVRDGYDYTQHMKEMGKGRFYSANGDFASQNALARQVALPEDALPSVNEQERLLDAITLTTEAMDADLREALVNDGAFEELDDSFVVQAATADPDDTSADDGFDYDAHIAKLMAAASGVPKYKGDLTDDEEDDDEDDDDEYDSEDEDVPQTVADRDEEQRALDEAFEKMMVEEYDSDQLGELEDDDPETRGDVVLEGTLLDSIVEDFVLARQEMLNDEGKVGNPLRSGNHLKEILEECEKERALEEGETEDEDGDEQPVRAEDPEVNRELESMVERSAYLAPRAQAQWDAETIVSTYSNLDNHPTVLREDGLLKKKKKKPMPVLDEEALAAAARSKSQILLSKKTGMPLGVFEFAPKKEKETMAASSQEETEGGGTPAMFIAPKIKRTESKEDKKARKEAVKALKQQRRQEKKEFKTAFKDEEQRQQGQTQAGTVSIFKYS